MVPQKRVAHAAQPARAPRRSAARLRGLAEAARPERGPPHMCQKNAKDRASGGSPCVAPVAAHLG
jgi:hypothetical protein